MADPQKKFYADFSTLASRLAPVTVSSLRSCLEEYGPGCRRWFGLGPKLPCSYARCSANFYRTLATFVLVQLLVVQSYWLVGSNLLVALPKLTAAEAGAAEERFNAEGDDPAQKPATRKVQLAENRGQLTPGRDRPHSGKMDVSKVATEFEPFEQRLGSGANRPAFEPCLEVLQQYVLPLLYGWLGSDDVCAAYSRPANLRAAL